MNEINIWNEITVTVIRLFESLLSATEHLVTHSLPRLLLAGVTLLLGWLIAVFLRKMVAKGLRGFGFASPKALSTFPLPACCGNRS